LDQAREVDKVFPEAHPHPEINQFQWGRQRPDKTEIAPLAQVGVQATRVLGRMPEQACLGQDLCCRESGPLDQPEGTLLNWKLS
jgi:hypothetical protein